MTWSASDAADRSVRVFSLEEDIALEVQRAGAKAAWLARGLRAGLPILPGFVVDAVVSKPYIKLGLGALEGSQSGAARLAIVGSEKPPEVSELEVATGGFGELLVVRSSSVLETGGEWSGAFASYLDLRHGELGVGVLGCWASIFTAASLGRFEAAGIRPDDASMAVLVQPALDAEFGGTARIVGDAVEIVAVKGSPAPLVQGWAPGVVARVDATGRVDGHSAGELLGISLACEIADLMRTAHEATGATGCEWAYADGRVVVFQLTRTTPVSVADGMSIAPELSNAVASRVGALVRRFPGPLGESLVLPWALGLRFPPAPTAAVDFEPGTDRLAAIRQLSDFLTAQVWKQPKVQALRRARETLQMLRGQSPADALAIVADLSQPDPKMVIRILGLLRSLAAAVVNTGLITDPLMAWRVESEEIDGALRGDPVTRRDRFGFDRWEPFTAAVVEANGVTAQGQPAGAGIAAGRMCRVLHADDMQHFRPRDVLVSSYPVPNLAPLLWDAAGIVTIGGGPGAHLFESARALGIPAVCGIRLEGVLGGDLASVGSELALSVNGSVGTVAAVPW